MRMNWMITTTRTAGLVLACGLALGLSGCDDEPSASDTVGSETALDAGTDLSAETAGDVAAETAEDAAAETTEDAAAETTEDAAAETTEDATAETTEDAAAETAEDAAAETTEDAAAETTQDAGPDIDTDVDTDIETDTSPDADTVDCSGVGAFTVCKEGEPGSVWNTDSCGNPTTAKTSCSPSTACEVNSGDGQAYCACPLTGGFVCKNDSDSGLYTLYTDTYIAKERACASAVPDPGDKVEECGFGDVCFQDEDYNNGEPLCHRSVTEAAADSPYYDHSCGTFSMWLRDPTNLGVDCRCRVTSDGSGGPGGTGSGPVDPNNVDINNGGFPAGAIINCGNPSNQMNTIWPVAYGEGPNFNAWFQQNSSGASWFSGDVNPVTREMYSIVKWTNPQYVKSATVVAWNLDTGNRRIISGLYPHPQFGQQVFGSGYLSPKVSQAGAPAPQPLTGANVIRLHSDGMLYTYGGGTGEGTSATREIVRIDPETGERTLVWLAHNGDNGDDADSWGQCYRPDAFGNLQSVGLNAQAFEVGPDGTFYLSMRGVREGDGLISISADGQTCTVLSLWGGQGHNPGGGTPSVPPGDPIGAGFELQFPIKGLLFHDGKIYGTSNDDLYSFNLSSGDRIKESWVTSTYGGMGFANMFWDPTREVIWAVGTVAPYIGTIVDLKTGKREPVYGDSEYGSSAIMQSVYGTTQSVSGTMLTNGHSIGYGGFVLDPANNDIAFAVLKTGGLMKLELSTFNNYVFSW